MPDTKWEVDGKVRKVYLKDLKKDEQATIDKLHGYSLVLGPYVQKRVRFRKHGRGTNAKRIHATRWGLYNS